MCRAARIMAAVPAGLRLPADVEELRERLGNLQPELLEHGVVREHAARRHLRHEGDERRAELAYEVRSGSDRFVHGFFTIGARWPAFASAQIAIGVPQPGFVVSSSGALPPASWVVSIW